MSTSPKFWSIFLLVCLGLLGLLLVRPVSAPPSHTIVGMNSTPTPHATAIRRAFRGVHRLNQLDPSQYASQTEYTTWWPSACSAAAMTEAINSYGYAYHITNILTVEAAFHNPVVITPDAGLWYSGGLDRTLQSFGFQAIQVQHPMLPQLERLAHEEPVIVNFPPHRWPGGHFLIVVGGDTNYVFLADSSRLDMHVMTIPTFLSYWRGLAFIVAPQGQEVQQ